MFVFAAINIFFWNILAHRADAGITPADLLALLTPLKIAVFGLATYRLADIISTEEVTEVLRAPFMEKDAAGFRGFFSNLINCPSCTGVWAGMFLLYLYLFLPTAGSALIILLMLTAFERFASKIYNFFDNMEKKHKN